MMTSYFTRDGRIGHCNQGNNMYLFPGIGLGTLDLVSSLMACYRLLVNGIFENLFSCQTGTYIIDAGPQYFDIFVLSVKLADFWMQLDFQLKLFALVACN